MTVAQTEHPPRPHEGWRWTQLRLKVHEGIASHGGEIRDAKGMATRVLCNTLGIDPQNHGQYANVHAALRDMEAAGLVEREMPNTRRVTVIRLVGFVRPILRAVPGSDRVGPDEPAGIASGETGPPPTPATVVEAPVPPAGSSLATAEGVNYGQLANALLAEVMATLEDHEAILKRSELESVKLRLGSAVEEAQRLRRKLGEAVDEVTALKQERDALRTRLKATEENLARAIDAGAVIVEENTRKAIDRFMRETPMSNQSRTDGRT